MGHIAANSILIVANLLSHQTVKVTKLSVPELVQVNTSTLTLDCEYVVNDDRFIVQWLFNSCKLPIYEWRPRTEPVVRELLYGRIDENYKVSNVPLYEYRALRIIDPVPELSGEYTCLIKTDNGLQDQQTKNMVIFSPEHEFVLTIKFKENVEIYCLARGLYPQPTVVLERNNDLLSKQEQRVWRNENLYDAASSGHLMLKHITDQVRITCRLLLPQAGYTAMRGETIHLKDLKQYLYKKECRMNIEPTKKLCQNSAPKLIEPHKLCSIIVLTNIMVYNKHIGK